MPLKVQATGAEGSANQRGNVSRTSINMTYYLYAMLQISTNEILKKKIGKLTFWELTLWELTLWKFIFWEVYILGVDILGVDILGVDILRLALHCHQNFCICIYYLLITGGSKHWNEAIALRCLCEMGPG